MDFLLKGTMLNGKYKIVSYMAKSDFSNIYLAENNLGEKVVIKECYPEKIVMRDGKEVFTEKYRKDFERLKRCFWKEKCILEKFRKKSKGNRSKFQNNLIKNGVIKILDFFSENGTNYIVMEYFGITLKEYILENKVQDEKININYIHCDLKPSNILVDIRGNIRIIDFGSSLRKGEKVDFIEVSEGYSPIEVYSEKVQIDERADVYSLSALLYFMLCGKKIGGAVKRFYKPELEFAREVILGFDKIEKFKEVEKIIKKGLEFERKKRFGSVREMIEKLELLNSI